MMEMKITVKESSIICPAQDTPKERLWISNVDIVMPAYHVPAFYIYKHNGSSDFLNPQVLKEGLSKTLVPFYPMAGRLANDENGRLEIICNAKGVLFIEAETDISIDDLGDLVPSFKMQQLIPSADYSKHPSSYPLFMAQVTTFKCGGASLGIGLHHILADGTASFHFADTLFKITRGCLSPIREAALIDRTPLKARVPPTPKFHHLEYDPPPTLNTSIKPDPQPKPSVSVSVLNITRNQLNILKLKAKTVKNENTAAANKYSTFSILASYIWSCVCKARGLQDDQPTKLYMPINGRPRLHPPLPSSYLGNTIFFASLIDLSGNVRSEPFINTVGKIDGTLRRMDDEYLRSALDYLEKLPDMTAARSLPEHFRCPNLCINNWMGLPLNDADLGWGSPIYMVPAHVTHEGKVFLVPNPTDDGSLLLVACLETPHMKAFQKLFYEGLMSFDKIRARY